MTWAERDGSRKMRELCGVIRTPFSSTCERGANFRAFEDLKACEPSIWGPAMLRTEGFRCYAQEDFDVTHKELSSDASSAPLSPPP